MADKTALNDIQNAFKNLSEAQHQFATDVDRILGLAEAACTELETRSQMVEQRIKQLESSDDKLIEKISSEIHKVAGGDDACIIEMIEQLQSRLDSQIDTHEDMQRLGELKSQNTKLAAELKLAKGRAQQLAKTVENQQEIIERDHALASEVSLLRQTLGTHRELMSSFDEEDSDDLSDLEIQRLAQGDDES